MKLFSKQISSCKVCPNFTNIPSDVDYCSDTKEDIQDKNVIHPLCRLKEIDSNPKVTFTETQQNILNYFEKEKIVQFNRLKNKCNATPDDIKYLIRIGILYHDTERYTKAQAYLRSRLDIK
jgi:hypothetical protein